MPLIKRGPMALGKRALNTGVRIAGDIMSGQNIKTVAKRRVTVTGKDLLSGLLATPGVRPQKVIKRHRDESVPDRDVVRKRRATSTCSTMAFVHEQSCEGVKSELDLFALPPSQTSIVHSHFVEHQPMASLDSGGPIEFLLPGSGDDYLDLDNTYLMVRAKVVNGDGSHVALCDPVGPVNNWLHSLFSQVDVYLNDTLVTPSTNTYAYRAYIEMLLSYSSGTRTRALTWMPSRSPLETLQI